MQFTFSRVGHIAPEFGRLANVLLGRGCGNPALFTYPPADADVEVVVVSPTSKLHELAEPHADGIFYLHPTDVAALAADIATAVRALRVKFAGRDFAEAREEFAAEMISAKIDEAALLKRLKGRLIRPGE